MITNSYGDTAAREFLILLAKDRGITAEPATNAILKGVFVPASIDVTGERFNIDKMNYVVTEKIADGEYQVKCETSGEAGNQYLGNMIPMNYIDGLESATLTEVLIPGEDLIVIIVEIPPIDIVHIPISVIINAVSRDLIGIDP